MCNCSCGSEEKKNALLPQVGIITDIRRETPDVKTFRIVRPDGTKLFEHMPGQCAMLCVPGVGEALFSITSSPTNKEYQEFSIKECGTLTNYLHNMSVGDEILVRGPYGNHFPVETVLKGQDLLFIAGGIGLAPLRSVINYVLDNRADYGTVDILYGSRSADDLVQLKEIQEVWMKAENVNVYLTIDREQEGWDGHVGFVPTYLKEIGFDTDKTALVCGPPIMIKFVLAGLEELGFSRDQVYWIFRGAARADSIFSGFVRGKLLDSLIIGVLCFIGCSVLKMPYTPLVSVFVGVTNVIPFFGPFLGAIPSLFLILLVNPLKALYFLLFVLALQQLDGNVIGPKILGDSTGLSSLWVIIAILVGGSFFGVAGMFFGVPVCACLYSLVAFLVDRRLAEKELPVETEHYTAPLPEQETEPEKPEKTSENL